MKKNIFRLIKIINLLFIIGSLFYVINLKNTINKTYSIKYKEIDFYNTNYNEVIIIPKINLKQSILKADDDFSNLNNNLVYYKQINIADKIIIFGHSGVGYGTYFNRLDELNLNDILYLYKDNIKYTYQVIKIYKIKETKVDILNEEKNSKKMLLITCDKNNNKKRLVIELLQKGSYSLKNKGKMLFLYQKALHYSNKNVTLIL